MSKPLLTDKHQARTQENFRNRHLNGHDPQPVVKLFTGNPFLEAPSFRAGRKEKSALLR